MGSMIHPPGSNAIVRNTRHPGVCNMKLHRAPRQATRSNKSSSETAHPELPAFTVPMGTSAYKPAAPNIIMMHSIFKIFPANRISWNT